LDFSKEQLLDFYRTMYTIRRFEENVNNLFLAGEIPGFVHLYIGEEAIATGMMANLSPKDYITSTHRGHGHTIAKGADLNRMMAEIFGKSTGYCKGKGGSMHIADFSIGMLGLTEWWAVAIIWPWVPDWPLNCPVPIKYLSVSSVTALPTAAPSMKV